VNALFLLLLCAVTPAESVRARAVVAVVEARIDAAQGPVLPDTPRQRKAPSIGAQPMRMELADPAASTASGRYVVTAYTGPNCKVYCKQAKAVWGDGDARVAIEWAEGALPEFVRVKLPKDYNFPVLVWELAGRQTYSWPKQWKIYSLTEIAEMCHRTGGTRESVAGAGPVAGVLHIGPQVEQMFTWWRGSIGEGVKATAEWDAARDKGSVSLLKNAEWSLPATYGNSGEFRLFAPGAKLPITEASLRYRFVNGKLRVYGETELDPSFLELNRPPQDVAEIGAGEPVGFGPMTILTVFSVLHGIWSITHPTCDVILPGHITCEAVLVGDNLSIKFTNAPSIRLVAWWEFNLGIQTVDINPQRVKVGLTGSRWFKSKTFQIGGAAAYAPEPVESLPVMDDPVQPAVAAVPTLLTTAQLKEFAARYRGRSTDVVGGDFRRHLTDRPNHGFTWQQVMGLTQQEAERVHSGHHNGALTTVAIISY